MSKVLNVKNLSKIYRLGEVGTGTISHDLNRWLHKIRGKDDPYTKFGQINDRESKTKSDYVWALRDINFSVNNGDVLGIIGKNGAGKSTLLKIISKITAPTKGKINYKGRIASLLEIGTGMNPELTARENIFLNGAILGMTKNEIKSKFDEIIDFSGCELYVDSPFKRFSSGMRVRLGFAVAAFLEPEILIVDEVLAVGDADFQKKAIGKMQDVSTNDGRTVLFVSHNMAAVKSLCKTGIVIDKGSLAFTGTQIDAVNFYQKNNVVDNNYKYDEKLNNSIDNENIKVLEFKTKPFKGEVIEISSGVEFELIFINKKSEINLDVTFELKNIDENIIFHHGKTITTNKDSKIGVYKINGLIYPNLLNSGVYKFTIIFGENQKILLLKSDDIIQFEVLNKSIGSNNNQLPGIIRPDLKYSIDFLEKI